MSIWILIFHVDWEPDQIRNGEFKVFSSSENALDFAKTQMKHQWKFSEYSDGCTAAERDAEIQENLQLIVNQDRAEFAGCFWFLYEKTIDEKCRPINLDT